MSMSSFDRPGVLDLSTLAKPAANAPGGGAPAPGGVVIDVTEATFADAVIQRSTTVPVLLDLWSPRSGDSGTLSASLQRVATEYAGRFLLARVDVDANQQLAAALQLRAVPAVFAIVKGQPVPLFEGVVAEEQIRQVVDQVLELAQREGVTGTIAVEQPEDGGAEPAEEPVDPRFVAAYDAIERDDFDAAIAAYDAVLAESPADADARAGLVQVRLMQRVSGVDGATALAAAEAAPTDVDAQLLAADVSLTQGDAAAAFARLVELVRVTREDDRDRARARLVELFEIVGTADPRVAQARSALANALF